MATIGGNLGLQTSCLQLLRIRRHRVATRQTAALGMYAARRGHSQRLDDGADGSRWRESRTRQHGRTTARAAVPLAALTTGATSHSTASRHTSAAFDQRAATFSARGPFGP